ncbi:MAG: pancreas/duodenum homeobox protein 1 [Thermodesulfobacteriota bacterium]
MSDKIKSIFTKEVCARLFPAERADEFFNAMFGDASEGSYDIALKFQGHAPDKKELRFVLELNERPGKCLACNLTYGLPEVFNRHPVINIKGLADDIDKELGDNLRVKDWYLGSTSVISKKTHAIPLTIKTD